MLQQSQFIAQLEVITDDDDFLRLTKSVDHNSLHELFEWKDEAGNCLLHLCVVSSRLDCFDQLLLLLTRLSLDSGKYVNGVNHYGRTPLHLAAFYGRDTAISRLLSLDETEIDKQTNAGCTALYFACCRSYSSAVKILLASGADPNVQTRASSTPLIAAAVNGNLEVVRSLLEGGALCNVQNNQGKTALHVAAENCNEDIMELLASYGASASIQDQLGRLASDLLSLAQKKRASTNLQSYSGRASNVRQTRTVKSSSEAPSCVNRNVSNERHTPSQPTTASLSGALSSSYSTYNSHPSSPLGRQVLNTIDNCSARQSCSRNNSTSVSLSISDGRQQKEPALLSQ